MHRAATHSQRGIVQRLDGAEALANVLECKRWRGVTHNPVGAAMNVEGMPKVVVRWPASA